MAIRHDIPGLRKRAIEKRLQRLFESIIRVSPYGVILRT
jgi:hypothetical protein